MWTPNHCKNSRHCSCSKSYSTNIKIGRRRFTYKYESKHAYNSDLKCLHHKGGVYCLFCKTTGLTYIGRSFNLRTRLARYRQPSYILKQKANTKICKHIVEYGPASFTYYILEYTSTDNVKALVQREQFWINNLKPMLNTNINVHPATFKKYDNTIVK